MAAVSAPVPLPLASSPALSSQASDERQINCFSEQIGQGQDARAVVYGAHGLTSFSAPPDNVCRGLIEINSTLFSVNGTSVYSISSAGTPTYVGTIPGSDLVRAARNAAATTQTIFVCNAGPYVMQGASVAAISDPDLPVGVVDVVWLAGYFVLPIDDGRFFWTAINDVTVNALDFATAEGNPDGLVGCATLRQELWLIGSKTIEVWALSGVSTLPFQRLPGGVIESGCSSKYTIRELKGQIYWLDEDGQVRRAGGQSYIPELISHRGVHDAVRAVTDKTEISAFSYVLGTHEYYVLTHSTFTWVFDANPRRVV
jgi:hypothetical protein